MRRWTETLAEFIAPRAPAPAVRDVVSTVMVPQRSETYFAVSLELMAENEIQEAESIQATRPSSDQIASI